MKKIKFRAQGFIAGIVVAVVFSALCAPALAAMVQKTISVATGVNIYIDDVKLDPKDANGNPVEPFIYNGTTYLPVRAIGEAFGKTVQWEGKTSSVYVGRHDSSEPAVMLKDLDYFTGKAWDTMTVDKDNLGNSHSSVIYCKSSTADIPIDNTYRINGQYSRITGTLYQRYDYRSNPFITSSAGTTIEIYGDGKLLYTATVGGGIDPIEFDVPLTGVLTLNIKYIAGHRSHIERDVAAIGECGLYT